jgi:HEAT repeat protein
VNLYNYLQQLPVSGNGKGVIDLPPAEKQEALNMVWEAFIAGEFHDRWELAKWLPKFGESAIAPLTELLEDETAHLDLRCEAAEILSKFQTPHAIFALTEVLQTEEESEVITACANALAKNGKVASPTLTDALANPETRLPAVQALAYLRKPETIAPLLSVVNDPQPEIRLSVIEALSTFRDSRVVEALMEALSDTNAQVRKEAVIGLGVRGNDDNPEPVVSALVPLLYDINLEVCSHCAIALGKLGTQSAIDALRDCLHSSATPSSLKQQIVRGLSHTETSQTLSILASNLQDQPPSIIQEIIAVFGRWKTSELHASVADTLIAFFHHHAQLNDSIKQTLAVALGNLGIPSGKSVLSHLAQDETAMVQLHAQAALKKLP